MVEPMNTRLMFVPPEFATSSVSGLFEMNMPHGSEPTATPFGAKPFVEPCLPDLEQVEVGVRQEDVAARRVDGDVADRPVVRQRDRCDRRRASVESMRREVDVPFELNPCVVGTA